MQISLLFPGTQVPNTVMGQESNTDFPLTALAQREAAGMEYLASSEYRKSWPIGQKYTATLEDGQRTSRSYRSIKRS
jgi:hypothetical protein